MKTQEFLKILSENKIWRTVIPSLNLWLFYAIICLIIWGVFNVIVAGLFLTFGIILGWAQKDEVKSAFCEWWNNLPLFKFHMILVLIQVGILLFIMSFTKPLILATNKNTKKHGERD